jgi:hypothetical protein
MLFRLYPEKKVSVPMEVTFFGHLQYYKRGRDDSGLTLHLTRICVESQCLVPVEEG